MLRSSELGMEAGVLAYLAGISVETLGARQNTLNPSQNGWEHFEESNSEYVP